MPESFYCAACGRRLPMRFYSGQWRALPCRRHPAARRYSAGWARLMFGLMKLTTAPRG